MANPFDKYARTVKELNLEYKRSKGPEAQAVLFRLLQAEARGGMYETKDGELALPSENVLACLAKAAGKEKKSVVTSIVAKEPYVPLFISGKTVKCDAYTKSPLVVGVRIMGKRIQRARIQIPAGWTATVTFLKQGEQKISKAG